jgi:hypothetical protein
MIGQSISRYYILAKLGGGGQRLQRRPVLQPGIILFNFGWPGSMHRFRCCRSFKLLGAEPADRVQDVAACEAAR